MMTKLWLNVRRMAWIVRVLIVHLAAHLLEPRLRRWPRLVRRLHQPGLAWPERLRALLEELGGTFIKLGQMLALQPDIVSFEICEALSNLLDQVAPFPYEAVERTFREELGRAPAEIFDSFGPVPIATASIGQVHVAYLDGRKLAVKIQRPLVDVQFSGDIRLMSSLLWLIRRLHLRALYWAVEPLTEFIAWTAEELDYRSEARYMEQLRINCQDNPVERVPEVLQSCTSRRTLVTEFFDGATLLGYLRAREARDEMTLRRLELAGFEPKAFARNVIDNFLGDAFLHGMFHADLHPANLMVLPGNVVGYVDFGITGVLSHYSRRHLVGLTLAYTRGDIDAMCQAFFKVAVMDGDSDPQSFRDGVARLSETWYEVQGRERRLRKNFTLVMLDMLRLSRAARVWPEQDVVKYIRSSIAIDGLITRFAPGFDVGRYLATACDRHLRQETWRRLFSYDRMVDWSATAGSLAQNGGDRMAGFVERATSRERTRASGARRQSSPGLEARAFRLATVVFSIALLVTMTGERAVLGANLFTAEILVGFAALTLFLNALRRCV
jgi:predicted unusual protein kinase regulating ubiquinone biosynthesis (AarF/ABC1/UbiB family)